MSYRRTSSLHESQQATTQTNPPSLISESTDPEKPISGGFYRLEKGTPLVYTYTYDEIKIIVDGHFYISDETGKEVKAEKGDVFFFPKGSKITFKTDDFGLGFFVGQRKKDGA